jgi:cytochrome c553
MKSMALPLMGAAALAALVAAGAALAPPARADSAEENYATYCARCHGDRGRADGPSVSTLSTKPRNFADCSQMAKISDDTMFQAVKDGGASVGLPTDMPSWSNDLSDDEIHELVKFVRAFCKQ